MQHVLVSSSSTGYIVIWDLRNKREVVALAYGGAGQVGIIGGGGRRGISDFAWHPSNVSCVRCVPVPHPSHPNRLRLVTSPKGDNSAVVVWDLRNAQVPEKVCFSDVTFDM